MREKRHEAAASGGNMAERTGVSGWSSIIATWISIVGAFGGGFLALRTYGEEVAKMEDSRVVQTFALFEMFNSAERLASRQSVYATVKDDAELVANDLYVFVDFYDALQICVDRNLCDRDLAVRLFQSYAVPVWDDLGATIIGARTDSDPYFGGGLQWMAGLPLPERSESPGTGAPPEPQQPEGGDGADAASGEGG